MLSVSFRRIIHSVVKQAIIMAQPNHTYVQYFIPADGDVEEHPNVFLLKKAPKSVTLADLQQVSSEPHLAHCTSP
jgi:hypothetical protein